MMDKSSICYSNYFPRGVSRVLCFQKSIIARMTNTRSRGSALDLSRIVRQTIVKTVEAPRLEGISTADFVKFKCDREVYERRMVEKNSDPNIMVPLTSYKNSTESDILEILRWEIGSPLTRCQRLRKIISGSVSLDMQGSNQRITIWENWKRGLKVSRWNVLTVRTSSSLESVVLYCATSRLCRVAGMRNLPKKTPSWQLVTCSKEFLTRTSRIVC